jgi:hypothetical protein
VPNRGGFIPFASLRAGLKATTAVCLVLVPLALAAGCRPVEWAELGAGPKREEPPRSQAQDGGWEGRADTPRAPLRESRPTRRPQSTNELRIVARSGREVVRLSPDDVIRIMQRVGFSDDQILDLGPDLYNALLQAGAAEVLYGKHTEMIFAVSNRQVRIQSRTRGTFVYDVLMQQFVLGSPSGPRR